jgi:O-antigen ligase
MQINQTYSKFGPKLIIVLCIAILFSYLGSALISSIGAGREKTVVLILTLPILLSVPYLLSRIGPHVLVMTLLFISWIPTSFLISGFFITEFGIWALVVFILISGLMSKNLRMVSQFKDFPIKPFLIYILGAVIAYLISSKTGGEIAYIRVICAFPLLLFLAILLTIKSVEEAQRYLWVMLISASLLGLLFIFGRNLFSFVTESDYASITRVGRLSMQLDLPFLGRLTINPASAGERFAFMFTLAYGFWLFHRTSLGRIAAGIMCLIFGIAILYSQGRGGSLSALISALIMTWFSLKMGKLHRGGSLLKLGIIISFLIGGLLYLALNSALLSYSERITVITSDPLSDRNLLSRMVMWAEGLKTFVQNPFGVGLFGFAGGESWAVHNIWLFQALSFGIIGFIGFLWIILSLLRAFRRGIRGAEPRIRNLSIIGIACTTDIIVAGQFSPIFWDTSTAVMLWGVLAILYATVTLNERTPDSALKKE